MQCSIIKRTVCFVVAVTCCSIANAGFNEATKAYLLGDFAKARYEALVGATDGDPAAQMLLGQLYFNGEGVEKDMAMSLYWYEKAASQDFSDAQYRLGSLYFDGKHDIPKDYGKAYQWLSKALENGNQDAKPKLEGLFKTESGKVVNLQESLDVLQQVAATGNQQARYLLSEKLLKGVGLDQNKEKAVAMLVEDAKQGFVKAQKRLGELYFYGDGVPQDYYEAYAWSMAYAGTNELGGLVREGKQIARSALRKLDDTKHQDAYTKSKQYFEEFVLPFHKNAREVGPDKYRIVVRSRKAQLQQARAQEKQLEKQNPQSPKSASPAQQNTAATTASKAAMAVGKDTSVEANKVSTDDSASMAKQALEKNAATDSQSPAPSQQAVATATPPDSSMSIEQAAVKQPDNRVANVENKPGDAQQSASGIEVSRADNQSIAIQPATVSESTASDRSITVPSITTPSAATAPVPGVTSAKTGAGAMAEKMTDKATDTHTDNSPEMVPGQQPADETAEKRRYRDVYNVLLRTKPQLQPMFLNYFQQDQAREGRVVFEMTISSTGQITDIEVISSELDSSALEKELVEHLKTLDFGKKKNAEPFKISFPVDFMQ